MPTFACINTAERFYHLLAKLLKKRGKKDFAIKIRFVMPHFLVYLLMIPIPGMELPQPVVSYLLVHMVLQLLVEEGTAT